MNNANLISQRNPHRRVTTIYLTDGTAIIVEVIEWGSGLSPNIVRVADGKIWRQGITQNWSAFPRN